MMVSSFNLSQSFNYAPYLFYKKRFKSEINCFCTRTLDSSLSFSIGLPLTYLWGNSHPPVAVSESKQAREYTFYKYRPFLRSNNFFTQCKLIINDVEIIACKLELF